MNLNEKNLGTSPKKKEKLWTGFFLILVVMYLFQSMGFSILNNVMALYVDGLFGKAVYAGYLNAAFGVAAIIARMVCGYFTDRFSRRAVMTVSLLIFAAGTLAFGLCSVFGLLLVFRFFQGFGFAGGTTAANAATADVVPQSRFAEGMGKLGLGSAVAMALGSSLILVLSGSSHNYSRVILFAAGMLLCGAVMAFICNYERKPFYIDKRRQENTKALQDNPAAEKKYKGIEKLIEKTALPAAAVQFFTQFSFACLNTFLLSFAVYKNFGNNISWYFTLSAAASFISSLFAGQLVDRFGVRKTSLPCLVLSLVSYAIIGLTDNVVIFCLTGLTFGLSNGINMVVMQSEGIRHAEPSRRGAASGTYMLSSDIANAIGGIFWGAMIDKGGFTVAFVGSCGFVAMAFVLVVILFRKKKGGKTVSVE